MAELMRRPRDEEIKKMREQLSDPITFALVQATAKYMSKPEDIDDKFILRSEFHKWKNITRGLIRNGIYVLLFTELERISEEVANQQWTDFKIPKERKKLFTSKNFRDSISGKIKITEIAKSYGLKVKGNKAICPFHADKDPSLSLSDKKGVFHCFGCGIKGDILTFIKKLEDLHGNKRGSK